MRKSKCALFFWAFILCHIQIESRLPRVTGFHFESYEDVESERAPGLAEELANLLHYLSLHFSCQSKATGFYADSAYQCEIFHFCDENGQGYPLICPRGSSFDQRQGTCTEEPSIECERAADWFHLNQASLHSLELTQLRTPTQNDRSFDLDYFELEVPTVLPLLPL